MFNEVSIYEYTNPLDIHLNAPPEKNNPKGVNLVENGIS